MLAEWETRELLSDQQRQGVMDLQEICLDRPIPKVLFNSDFWKSK